MVTRRLPLFPLPVVLFPGEAMPLHIFELRYRRMVDACLAADRRFGLLHHDWDEMGPFLNEPGRIGTVAEIEAFRPLPDGRSLLRVRGRNRFRIVREVREGAPYFEAIVDAHEDVDEAAGGEEVVSRRRRSILLFEAAVRALEIDETLPRLDPEREISFSLARRIRIDAAWKQALLELRDEERRLERLDVIFRRALEEGADGGRRAADGRSGPAAAGG